MKPIRSIASAAGGLSFLTLMTAACGTQAGPDYSGETLAEVHGVVVNELTANSTPDAVVLANWGSVGAMFAPGGDVADVTGSFPAAFTLSLYEPPPEELLYYPSDEIRFDQDHRPFDTAGESRIALGHLIAVAKDDNGAPDVNHVIGGAEAHALVYVEEDMQAGSFGAMLFHEPLKAGFHLIEVRPRSNEDNQTILDCEVAATTDAEWIACGINSVLFGAAAEAQVTVRLVDSDAELNFISLSPVYLPLGYMDPGPTPCGGPMNPCMTP